MSRKERRRRERPTALRAALSVVVVLVTAVCRRTEKPDASTTATPGVREVVVYSSADKEFAELIFKAYEARSGVKVLPVYDAEETKTAGLAARLLAEQAHPRADVFWSSDTSRALGPLPHPIAAPYVSPSAPVRADRHLGGIQWRS